MNDTNDFFDDWAMAKYYGSEHESFFYGRESQDEYEDADELEMIFIANGRFDATLSELFDACFAAIPDGYEKLPDWMDGCI